jgi:hypothetical protein
MKDQLAIATYNGFVRFNGEDVQFVEEARDASIFSDRREAQRKAENHQLTDSFILVEVSNEIARTTEAAPTGAQS